MRSMFGGMFVCDAVAPAASHASTSNGFVWMSDGIDEGKRCLPRPLAVRRGGLTCWSRWTGAAVGVAGKRVDTGAPGGFYKS